MRYLRAHRRPAWPKAGQVYEAQRQAVAANPAQLEEWKQLDLDLVAAALKEGIIPQDYTQVVEGYYAILRGNREQATTIRRQGDVLTEQITTQLAHAFNLEIMGELSRGQIPEILKVMIAVGVQAQENSSDDALDQTMGSVIAVLFQHLAPKADAEFDKKLKELPDSWRILGSTVANYQKLMTQLAVVAQAHAYINVTKGAIALQPDHELGRLFSAGLSMTQTDFDVAYEKLTDMHYAEQETNAEMVGLGQGSITADEYVQLYHAKKRQATSGGQASSSVSTFLAPEQTQQMAHFGIDPQNLQRLMRELEKVIRPTSVAHLPVDPAQALVMTPEMEAANKHFLKTLLTTGFGQGPTLGRSVKTLTQQVVDEDQRRALLPSSDGRYQLRLTDTDSSSS